MINSRLTDLKPLYKVNSVYAKMSPSTTGTQVFTISAITGYTPVAITGLAASGTYDGGYQKIYQMTIEGYLLRVGWSVTNSSGFGCTVYILHIKN